MSTNRVFAVVIGLLSTVLFGTVLFATGAAASPPDESGVVERGDGQQGFIYWSDGYLAMVGNAENFCFFPEPPTGPGGTTVSPANGAVIDFTRADVPVSVYEYPGPGGPDDPTGGFEFLGANCGAIFDGDPSTEPIAPVATGEVRLRAKFRTDTQGVTHGLNSLVGSVTTTDGRQVRLSTSARVEFIAGGPLIELSRLEVRYRD